MPLKRTYSSSTTIVPAGYQQTKKRNLSQRRGLKRIKRYPINGTVGKPRPFPTRMVATLKYCTTVLVPTSVATVGNWNFACNSIYDPDFSGSGHQPYGHDTYATIYNQYTVLRSRIVFKPLTSTTQATALTWGGGIEDTVTGTPAADTWMEKPTYIHRKASSMVSPDMLPLTLYWDRAKRFPHEDLYRTVSAPFGANPSEVECFNLVVQNTWGNGLTQTPIVVEIEYFVEMYELKDLGSS